jgi:thymidine kinase
METLQIKYYFSGGIIMEKTLAYLRESLSNFADENTIAKRIYAKIETNQYEDETSFVDDLEERETIYLNDILSKELEYAEQEQDTDRYRELSNVYERLI